MAKNMQPIAKRCKALGISPAVMGYAKKETNRNPGGQMRKKKSEYGIQLNEKQKVKFIYGILEKQFHAYYEAAAIRHYAPAQWKFGRMLFEGDGIPQDTERGASWLSLAALEGSDEASMYLASKGMPVPQPLPKTTFQAMHEHAERAWDDRNRRYWSGILQDSTDLLISAAAIYVHTQSQASANSANRSTRTTPTKPITPSVQPTYKKQNTSAYTQVRMLTKPTYCYAYDAGSFDSGSTLYLRKV